MFVRVLATDKDLLAADGGFSAQRSHSKVGILTVDLRVATHYSDGQENMLCFAGAGSGSPTRLREHPAISHLPEASASETRMTLRNLDGQRHAALLTETGEQIASLSAVAETLSQSLAVLAAESRAGAAAPVTATMVRRLIKFRRERENLFPPGLFADPAWDILLTLVAARLDGSDVSVSSLCMAAGVPPSTGLRWVGNLIEQGMLERQPDPQDARRILIVLAEPVFETMLDWLQRSSSAA